MVVAPKIHPPIRAAARPAEGLWPLLEEERLLAPAVDLEHVLLLRGFLDEDVAPAHALPELAVRPVPGDQLQLTCRRPT